MSVVSRLSDMTRSTSLGIMRRRRLFSSIVMERCVSSICEGECSIVISYGGPMPGLYGEAMRNVRRAHTRIFTHRMAIPVWQVRVLSPQTISRSD